MRKSKWLGLVLLGILTLGMGVADVLADPPPWAPAHGRRAKYRYVYYPNQYVYYNVVQQKYFWLDNGKWHFGISLPEDVVIMSGDGIVLEMGTPTPYLWHRDVIQIYPARR